MTKQSEIPTLIKNTILGSNIKLVQNDNTNDFYIKGIDDIASIIVSDLNCKVLLKQNIMNEELVSISSFLKGIYIAKIITATVIVEKKLVKK